MTDTRIDAPFYSDHSRLLVYLDEAGQKQPISSPAGWERRRAHILANMQSVMGPLPGPEKKVPLDMLVDEEFTSEKFIRKKITFAAEKDDRVPAYLFLPRGVQGKVPGILCLHQTNYIGKGEPAGLGGLPNLHYALELAERGYVALVPDYPNFGEYQFDSLNRGYASGTMKAIWNNMRAVDLLQSLPEVEGQRIGCIGHSLGGHNSMFSAAFDARIAAIVSSCGFTAFHAYYGGDLAGWTSATYMPRIKEIGSPAKMPFDFHEIVAAFAPRAFFANAPLHDSNFDNTGVREVMHSAQEIYALLNAKDRLEAVYPDAEHDFPPVEREQAYQFLDRWLRD